MLSRWGEKIFEFFGERDSDSASASHLRELYQQLSQFYTINDLFPYESYDDKYQLFFNGNSIGFVLETPPLVGSSEEMQKEIDSLFKHLLPEESNLQVMLWADPHIGPIFEKWQAARQAPLMQSMAKKRIDHLKAFAFESPHKPYSLRNFRCFFCFSQKSQSENPVILESLNQLKNQLKTTLEMLGLPVNIWGPKELINTISNILNMDQTSTTPFVKRWNKMQSISDQLSDVGANLKVHKNSLSINEGNIRIRSYQAAQAPEVWSLHAMGQLIGDEDRDMAQIPCPFIIHYGIHIPKQGGYQTEILPKAKYVIQQADSPIGKWLPTIQKEAKELQFVIDQIAKGERIVLTQFSVILFADSILLTQAEQILLNLFYGKEWRLLPNRFLHLPVFLAAMPMTWGEETVLHLLNKKKLKTTISTEAANLLPLQGEWKGTPSQGMILGGRRGQVMTWSPFDNKSGNYNVCVVGRSGSGKSVFMQEFILTNLGLGGKVFVLDVGRSFEKTCYLLEGQFIEFKANTPLCLNPFSTIPVGDEDGAQDALSMLKPILNLMAAPTRGVDDMEAALLEQAMLDTWKNNQQESNISHIAQYLLNHTDKKAQDLGTMLFPYTEKGLYGRFFNGKSTVNLENALVVIELEELKDRKDLQSVVVQMVIINITNRMFLGDRKTPFSIVFDEAWDLLRGTQSGVFIETLARRLRKYNGSLVVGTQTINDFFASPAAQAAFDNSDWMCILSQKSESIELLKKLGRISLTPMMESQLKSVKTKQGQYSEVMIYGSNGYAIGRLLLDPYSQLLFSTTPEDYSEVQSLRNQGISLGQALETLLNNRR